jgi:hypothetical protein
LTLVISDLRRDHHGGKLETSVAVRLGTDQHRLSIIHSGDIGDLAGSTPEFDPFLTLLLIPAMARNMPIVVEGAVQAQRLDTLRRGVQTILSRGSVDWTIIPIEADAQMKLREPDSSKGAALGMSCGIDSLYTYMDMKRPEVAENMRVKLLFHNDVGAHPDKTTFERHRDHARRFAGEVGLPLISAEIDLRRYYSGRFIHSHTLRNAGAAMSIETLFHTYLYSKANSNLVQKPIGRGTGFDASEPMLLPLLNTNAQSYQSHGMHIDRLNKTNRVMRDPLAERFLTVCTHSFKEDKGKMNCGRCQKCARALFFADVNDRLDAFAETFDITAFKRNKNHGLLRLLRHSFFDRKSPEDREMLAYLFENDYEVPRWFQVFRGKIGASNIDNSMFP